MLALAPGCRGTPPAASPSRVAALDPVEATQAQGDIARSDGRLDDAVALYERAIAADPGRVTAHLRLVGTLTSSGRGQVARERYAARAAAPDATEVERVIAARLASDGSLAAVRTIYVEAAKRSPGNPWWRLALAEIDLAAAQAALQSRDAARDGGDRPRAEAFDQRARRALARAESAVEHAGERGASIAEVSLFRGLVRSFEGDLLVATSARAAAYRAAVEAFRRATIEAPDLVDAWANLGDASGRAGDQAEAIRAYGAAVRLAPHDADLREGLGHALHEAERHADAAAQYAEAARLRPRDSVALLSVGDSWAAAGDFVRALAAYDEALIRNPATVEAHAKRGATLEHLGRLAEAREAYAIYIERNGKNTADVSRRIERILSPEAGGAR